MNQETKDLVGALNGLITQINELIQCLHQDSAQSSAETKQPVVAIETVREVLAQKAQAGKQAAVKALITKFGANKLTELDPSCFEKLLTEVEEL
jgi:hypothetical protein